MDRIAFGALIKRKRGEARLTQETLAGDVFGDPGRKADISRIENGHTKPQEATIQKLCDVLKISAAEMEPIRQARPAAEQLANIPALSREDLQNLAARFELDGVYTMPDGELRRLLTLKADEHRALKSEVDNIDDGLIRLSNLKAAAQDAIARVNLDEVEDLLSRVQEVELEEAAKTAELRANNALLRGRVDQAYRILCAAADSFAAVDLLEPARRKILGYAEKIMRHDMRFGGAGLPLSVEMMRQTATDDLRSLNAWLWAAGKNTEAIGLRNQGTRTDGPKGADLLAQAVAAYRAALEVRTRADHPADWAMTQNNLGIALQNQGTRTEGPKGADLLAQAVVAYRAALEVRTRAYHPVDWAMTQNNLGAALRNQGTRTDGPKGTDLLAQAIAAYRAALEVYTHADHPVDWAMTQNNIGIALQNQGTRTDGPKGADLLAQAVAAFRAALEVYTRADHPVNWATTQNNLGAALQHQGTHTDGPKGANLLAQAVTAFRAALEVRTRADQPVQWAMTQENIAVALLARAERVDAQHPRDDLAAALAAVDGALEVFDPENMSFNYEKATRSRADIQAAMDALGDEATEA
ncbi:helix-turn-helix domain-containing protein [Tateyamaria sp.]|uniref:helix-turn-helix domain-containing protein n=1 Tax=Tateyamaria sp. TaxID=1929288 RepID=UPI00326C5579